jgi:hypothetical protein
MLRHSEAMRTNIYGLPLRSTVRSRRPRLLRATIGLALLALLCLVYPGARDLTAQLLGIGTEPSLAADVAPDEPATVATKKSPKHGADNPLAADARAAAGLILPELPSEAELLAYVAGEQPYVVDFDDAVSDDFRDVAPASEAAVDNRGGGRLGGRWPRVPSVGVAGGGFGGVGAANAAPEATIAANETPAGGDRVGTMGHRAGEDLASTATAASKIEAVNGGANGGATIGAASSPSSGGSASSGGASSGGGSASGAGSAAGGAGATAFADAAPADIAPGAMVIAELTGGGALGAESSGEGAQPPFTGGLAADGPGVLADVPEPALLLIFGLGLAAVAYRMRSRLG